VTTARHPRPQPRQARQPTPAPPGRLGTDVPQRDALPTAVHGAAPQEAGARSNPTSLPSHRTRHGLPVHAIAGGPAPLHLTLTLRQGRRLVS
jgi:hypothetical protein